MKRKAGGTQRPQGSKFHKAGMSAGAAHAHGSYVPRFITATGVPGPRGGLVPPGAFRSAKGEVKAIDILEATYPLTAAPATNVNVSLLNIVQEGTGFFNRVGRKIEMRSLHVTGLIQPTGTAQTQSDLVQWAIIYDRQPSAPAALPVYNLIFGDYTAAGGFSGSEYSGLNLDNRDRFVVIRNKRLALPSTTAVLGTNPSQVMPADPSMLTINEFIKLKRLTTHYNGTANPITIANVTTGALYIVTQGGFAAGAQGWSAQLQFRLRYDDL